MYCLQSQSVVERAFYNQFIFTHPALRLIQLTSWLIAVLANTSTKMLGLELNLAILGEESFTEYESIPLCDRRVHLSAISDSDLRELHASVRFLMRPSLIPFEGLVFLDLER